MYLHEIVRCVSSVGIKEERSEDVTRLLNLFLKHDVKLLGNLLKEGPQDQAYALSFQNIHLPVSRKRFAAGMYAPCLRSHMKDGSFIHDRQGLRKQLQHVPDCD